MDSARLIDLHQHIIHGVDDGPTDFARTQAMLRLAAENGVTTGITPTTFCPANTCTRAHVVTFLYRALA